MIFKKLNNIETAFQHVRTFTIIFLICCVVLTAVIIHLMSTRMDRERQSVYILSGGKVLEALASDRKTNLLVEARDHVKTFHELFFGLEPDEKVIEQRVGKAMYLADVTAKRQYDILKEQDYFANMIAADVSQTVAADSISVTGDDYPLHFVYTGKETITRPSSIATRSLVTEGLLRETARSDNNPHGFIIEKWKIIENEDLQSKPR